MDLPHSLGVRRVRPGFTLIELMIVVAIIGILASVAIPQFRRFQCRAKQSEAKMLLKAIGSTQSAYFGEFGSYVRMTGLTSYAGLDPASLNRTRHYQVLQGVIPPSQFFFQARDTKQPLDSTGMDLWNLYSEDNNGQPWNMSDSCVD